MQIFVWTDDEGDFHAHNLNERDQIWSAIHEFDFGDTWANRENEEEYPDDLNYKSLSDPEWMDFMKSFEQPARIAIVDLS